MLGRLQPQDGRVSRDLIPKEKEKEGQGQISFTERLFNRTESAAYFKKMDEAKDPVMQNERVRRGNREFVMERKTAFFGDEGASYSYAGIKKQARKWGQGKMGRIVNGVRKKVEKSTGIIFSYAILGYFPKGTAGLGFHSDDERDLDPTAPIVSVSFGATRDMVFKHKKGEMDDIKVALPSGCMLKMHPPCQSIWKHGIPVRKGVTTGRFNLTFRVLKDC